MIDKIMFWDVQGLGTSKSRLQSLLKKFKPKVLIVAEHFREDSRMLRWQNMLRFDANFSNGAHEGKLWIFSEAKVHVSVLRAYNQQVMMLIFKKHLSLVVSAVYAKCLYFERRSLWSDLIGFSSLTLPWVVLGNFNIIREDSERRGGNLRLLSTMEDFYRFMDVGGLVEIPFSGNKFSWCNGHGGMARS
ncbi:hypothetical protein F2P56_018710 [Juglans regia]|uniref:Uncharacterized protein LOC108981551 n=2 Tax=Juglans regia TaxID=51240 RepID=A0A2I4DME0_JUGRE|nr:uncharacterized protein LOC108981551 [Juglans regia]KAF5462727.1 hypothetical protein F2P56_018710 [Juglans regia]